VSEYPEGTNIYEKSLFSMVTEEVKNELEAYKKSTIVLYGIEAHVCIQQTCLDLIDLGYNVFVLTDCISSSREIERSTAILRMSQTGAQMTTLESAIFEIMRHSKHESFKELLSEVIKDTPDAPLSKL
jgi:nicotinamidase-related amidase